MKIPPLSKTDEKKLLAAVLVHLAAQPANGIGARLGRELVLFLLALLVLLVGSLVFSDPMPLKFFLAGTSLVTGLAIGFAAWRYTAAAQWPAVARCIDRAKVEARLRELDA